ncbi:hypothetical protein MP638_004166, partial [Amoeboaphelidium occidentale]
MTRLPSMTTSAQPPRHPAFIRRLNQDNDRPQEGQPNPVGPEPIVPVQDEVKPADIRRLTWTQKNNVGLMAFKCQFCDALLFEDEEESMCCGRGVQVDERVQRGVYNFRIHGEMYHRIGNFLPEHEEQPKFHQIYIYDSIEQLEHRHNVMGGMNEDVAEVIQEVIIGCNPFAAQFKSAAQIMRESDVEDLKMVIYERKDTDRRRYNLPTASEVAVIVQDNQLDVSSRDIVLQKLDGYIRRISEMSGAYIPLHYVLFFPGVQDEVKPADIRRLTWTQKNNVGLMAFKCQFCDALLFEDEEESMCCGR